MKALSLPRRQTRPNAEPSIPLSIRLIVALLGARRAMPPRLRRRLELSGLPWDEIAPILARIRGIESWAKVWEQESEASAASGDWRRAAAQVFLGQLILSPFHPQKAAIQERLRAYHLRTRQARPGLQVTPVSLVGGRLSGLWERPNGATKTPILLLPPLASVKEEMALLADPLLAAGHPVLRLELPGQGESPGPLGPDTESLLSEAITELGIDQVFAGGISLGAFYALRLAHVAPGKVLGVFGISPPAMVTARDWARVPPIIFQYLDIYFATRSREETRRHALALRLDDAAPTLTCPVLLYHGLRDRINPPEAPTRYHELLQHLPLTERLLADSHACMLHLRDTIGPEIADWADGISPSAPR